MTKNLLLGLLAAAVSCMLFACGGNNITPPDPPDPNKKCTLAPVDYYRTEVTDPRFKDVIPDIKLVQVGVENPIQWQASGIVRLADNEPNGHWKSPSGFENISPGKYKMWAYDNARFIVGGPAGSNSVGKKLQIGGVELTKMVQGQTGGEYAEFTLTNGCTISQ